jgi:prepilin-type processing-associated H-X9-DG protein
MQCGNNLKQIGLALHNYADTYKVFPSGFMYDGAFTPPRECWGWGALILPFMEQANIHAQIQVTKTTMAGAILSASWAQVIDGLQRPLSVYMCPSDTGYQGRGQIHGDRHFGGAAGFMAHNYLPGVSNYVANNGHGPGRTGFEENSGMFYGNSSLGFRDIIDGSSNTFAVGERDTKFCRSSTWVGVRNGNGGAARGVFVILAHARVKLNESVRDWNHDPEGCGQGWSSLHPGGAQFVFCDGSVTFISETINFNHSMTGFADSGNPLNGTYQRMISRADGLAFSMN